MTNNQNKNRFLTFIFSLVPGAAEMYLGFMKNGVSLMAVFFLSFIIPSVLRTSDVFILLSGLIWAFGFFHALNLSAVHPEIRNTWEDRFIWEEYGCRTSLPASSRFLHTWGAVLLIVWGFVMLWQSLTDMIYAVLPQHWLQYVRPALNEVPQIVIAVLIILVGLRLIRGKKEELTKIEEEQK